MAHHVDDKYPFRRSKNHLSRSFGNSSTFENLSFERGDLSWAGRTARVPSPSAKGLSRIRASVFDNCCFQNQILTQRLEKTQVIRLQIPWATYRSVGLAYIEFEMYYSRVVSEWY